MTYVADTHAFLWHMARDNRLGPHAGAVFRSAEQGDAVIVLPMIVVAECLMVIERKRLGLDYETVLDKLKVGLNFTALHSTCVCSCARASCSRSRNFTTD